MGDMILQFLGEVVCYGTGRLLLPVISLGQITVEDAPGPWWKPFARLPNGKIAVSHDGATMFGLIVWVIVVVAAVIAWRSS